MLNAAFGAAASVGGAIAGWDGVYPYYQGPATQRLYIVNYPSAQTGTNGSWAKSNCACNSTTGH
jgi:hypothetical protein